MPSKWSEIRNNLNLTQEEWDKIEAEKSLIREQVKRRKERKMSEIERAIEWFENRKAGIALPGARMMNNLALTALRAQLERENPKPLTVEELKERVGKPIFTVTSGVVGSGRWEFLRDEHKGTLYLATMDERYEAPEDTYGKTWLAYRYQPKEEV